VVIQRFSCPGTAEAELRDALLLEAERSLQMASKDLVIDWRVDTPRPSPSETQSGTALEGVFVAVPRAVVDRHLAILRTAGLYPVACDVAPTAVCALYLHPGRKPPATPATALVHLSRCSADMSILANGDGMYPRTFFAHRTGWEEATDYLVSNITDELRYHQYKRRCPPVERIVLTGRIPAGVSGPGPDGPTEAPGTQNRGLPSRLEAASGVPVTLWNPLDEVAVESGMGEHLGEPPPLAVPMGLSLEAS
jgi:Tfp pilus assembly PilM family ATPase